MEGGLEVARLKYNIVRGTGHAHAASKLAYATLSFQFEKQDN
jgi:hypothetical protein